MNIYFKKIFLGAIIFLPVLALAQDSLNGLVIDIARLIDRAVPVIIGIALLIFLWGIYRYVFATEEDKKEAVAIITSGIVILFVMISVWGLVFLISETFQIGISSNGLILPPKSVPVLQLTK